VSKKFCRDLKRSLRYGVQDLVSELLGGRNGQGELRKAEFWSVKGVSFELKRGEALGLIGPNGAGKTTLLRMLNGLIKPDEGSITMRGRVGALIQLGAGFNPVLTGRENIYVNAAVLGISKKEIDQKLDEIIDFADIADFIDAPVRTYSSGMQVRLGFSVAINLRPDVLLIDEVLAVGDLVFRNKCMEAIQEIRDSGVAFIFVSHNVELVNRLCDKAIFLKKGQVILYDTTEKVVSAYVTDYADNSTKTYQHYPGTEKYMQIHSVALLDINGQPIDQVVSGSSIIIRVEFETKSFLKSPLFSFKIEAFNRQIIVACFHQEKNKDFISFDPGIHVFDVTVKRLALLAGLYQLRLSVVGPNFEKYGKIFNLATIKVVARDNQMLLTNLNGFVELEADWNLRPHTNIVTI
jgi:lipopolysaccharide transport system ATP-binding protein